MKVLMHRLFGKYKYIILCLLILCIPFIHAFLFLPKEEIIDVLNEALFAFCLILGLIIVPFVVGDWTQNFKIIRLIVGKIEDLIILNNRKKGEVKKYHKKYNLKIIRKFFERKIDI